ncbi:MAG: energy-coupled thiamine transporter ThiT [Clostridia bacterium]|nr:energy-coupled thiamine transporter ThiT [Clostridia bacterium]
MFNLLSTHAIDLFLPIAKWLAIGVIVLSLIAILIVALLKKERLSVYFKTVLFIVFLFLLALGITALILDLVKSFNEGDFTSDTVTFVTIPVVCLFFLLLVSAVILAVVYKKFDGEKRTSLLKKSTTILGIINLVAVIVCGVLMAVYFEKVKEWYPTLNQTALYISSALVVITIVALAFILNNNDKPFDTKCLALAGITVAMSFGLSFVKIFRMPQGGSITCFSLLPIMIFSYVYGTKKGVFVCLIYGVLQGIQDPWIIHPAQFILDYPVAFASIGISGAFAKLKAFNNKPQLAFLLGAIPASSLRFISHVLSGVFAFASTYAGDINSWIYSLGYNSYVFIDIAVVMVIGAIVFSSKTFTGELDKLSNNI